MTKHLIIGDKAHVIFIVVAYEKRVSVVILLSPDHPLPELQYCNNKHMGGTKSPDN